MSAGGPPAQLGLTAAFAAFDALGTVPVAFPVMSFRRGSGVTAAISILATIGIFGAQQVPAAAAVKAAAPATAAAPPTVSAASSYRPIAPSFRILDTRPAFVVAASVMRSGPASR